MHTILWLKSPLHATWYITTRCNLRCSHCYLTDYTKQTDAEAIYNLLTQFSGVGIKTVSFIGGEPLVRKDLEQIIYCARAGDVIPEIVTNGILASRERANSLVGAGCERFQVSLEGHAPELSDPVRGKDTFQAVLAGAAQLTMAGAKVCLNVTISQLNYMHVPQILHLAESMRVDSLRLSAFVPQGQGLENCVRYQLNRNMVEHVRAVLRDSKTDTRIVRGIFSDKPPLSCGFTFGCGAGTRNVVINHDMTLSACDMMTEAERTAPIKDISELLEYWQQGDIFKKWRGLSNDPSYREVHKKHCHLAYLRYGSDIFS